MAILPVACAIGIHSIPLYHHRKHLGRRLCEEQVIVCIKVSVQIGQATVHKGLKCYYVSPSRVKNGG